MCRMFFQSEALHQAKHIAVIVRKGNEMAKAHPGFKAVQRSIAAKQGISPERAGAILASKTRAASPSAKKANPRLKRVKG